MPSLADICSLIGVRSPGDGAKELTGVASLTQATPGELSFLTSDRRLDEFQSTRAAAVLVDRRVKLPADANPTPAVLLVDDAELALAKALPLFAPPTPHPPAGIDPTARIAESAAVDPTAAVGPFVVIGERVTVGPRCRLHAGVVLGDAVSVGEDSTLFPNVVIRERCTLGRRVIVNAGSVIGTDGFGYRWDGRQHVKVPQIGTVTVEDDVEIGSCVCIDRAKFGETRLGRGTKVDNLVQIAHNVTTGPHCIIVGQVGLAGSVSLGAGVILGGQVAVRDHAVIGDGARAAATAGIVKDIPAGQTVSGTPALPHRQSLREQAAFRQLPELIVQVRKLQEEIDRLSAR